MLPDRDNPTILTNASNSTNDTPSSTNSKSSSPMPTHHVTSPNTLGVDLPGLRPSSSTASMSSQCSNSSASRRASGLPIGAVKTNDLISMWADKADEHVRKQKENPFSGSWSGGSLIKKGDEGYGRPQEGSLTEARGAAAQSHIDNEVDDLISMIALMGSHARDKTRITIEFGRLFNAYSRISSNVVGLLKIARKRGYLDFPGEILFQGQDDDVEIDVFLPCALLPGGDPRGDK